MIVAKIKVDGVCAVAEYRKLIPAGIIGAQVLLDYADDVWQGLRKTVVFRGAVTKDVITDDEVVTIPAEVVAKPNVALCLGVYGVDADGNIAIPTLWADLGNVRDAADPSGDPSTDPSLPVWTKLQAMIGDLDKLNTTAKENLVAAVNEAMTQGGGSVDEAEIQRIVEEYLAANPPTVIETDPTVPPWAKQPQKPTYTADEVHALPDTYTPPNQTAQQVGADPAGTAATAVSQHNVDTAAHNDLRVALQWLSDRVNAALDSDDTTLDQLSEIVTYIKSNKSLIDAITTSKVSVWDIVNDLITNVADKPLSAAQGVVLNGLIEELRTLIPDAYTLPVATETALGGVKPVTATDAMTQLVGVTAEGRLVTKPGEGGGISVTGATVGQTVKIAAVDDDGVPTAWEPVDWPGEECELLTKNAETGEEEPIVMDAETLRYNFPSLADYKKLLIIIKKKNAATTGLTGYVWFRYTENTGFLFSPSYANSYVEIDASLPGMCALKYLTSNNLQVLNSSYSGTYTNVQSLESPFWTMPNADWAEYYANCNTTITVWGVRR